MALRSGLDVFLEDPSPLAGKRLGLVVNPASVTSLFVPAAAAFREAGLDVRILFGPEHGLAGAAQDMIAVDHGGAHAGKGPCVVSLYGTSFEDLSPRPEHLAGLDAVVCDLLDVGSRYYTFVWTIALMMEACARADIPVFVLDRPNPLGGLAVEGNLPDEALLSFVGLYPLPARHGMTAGEIARYVNAEFALGCDLFVVPVREDGRRGPARRESLTEPVAWVMPSPNMPTPETALVYPGACLFEGTNLSEGRGTTRPFELIGAPWLDGEDAARAANALGLPGVVFRPHTFEPTFQKHAGQSCGGVQIHVTDAAVFRSFETGLHLLKALRDLDPSSFRWRTEVYEYRDDVPAIDLLAGTARYRELVDAGEPIGPWIATFEEDLAHFAPVRHRHLLYPEESARRHVPAILIVGAHESGKTTLAAKLVAALSAEGLRMGAVKHTPHEYDTDVAGKDSHSLAAAGANPALLVAGRRTARHQIAGEAPRLAELLESELGGCDAVIVEGYRGEPLPKIEVVRAATGRAPVAVDDDRVFAVVTDMETPHPPHVPRFTADDVGGLLPLVRERLGR